MKSLLVAAYLLVVQTVHAQFKDEPPHLCQTNKQGDTLRITNIFIKDTGELLKEYYKDAQDCSVLFLGVRFQINNHGEVCNLNASINTPDF